MGALFWVISLFNPFLLYVRIGDILMGLQRPMQDDDNVAPILSSLILCMNPDSVVSLRVSHFSANADFILPFLQFVVQITMS